LALLPTVYVSWTAWTISRPSHLRQVEAEIGRRLGLQATLEGVRYPRPGEVVYRGIVLRRHEPGREEATEIVRAEQARLRSGEREITLETEGLRCRGESPRLVMAEVGSLLQRAGDVRYERINLSAPTLDLDLGAGVPTYRLRHVVGEFLSDRETPTVRASYQVTALESNTRCELLLTRDRKAEPVRTTLAFKTMEGLPLPACVLDPFFDSADWLGAAAKVEGTLTLRQEGAKDWEADFQGNLLEIELAELVGRRFVNHRLRGRARLSVAEAHWGERPGQGFGWVDVRGELAAGPGMIGFGLLRALNTEMRFRLATRVARIVSAGQVDLDFSLLAFRFALSGDGEIRIEGALGNEYAGDAVLVGPTEPLAYAPEGVANVRGLIKTLFPVTQINHGELVPLTEKSRLLLCLPVPPDLAAKPIGGN
jgi:hypothetical protein